MITKYVALSVLTATWCAAQGRVSEFLGVTKWYGTVTISGSGVGSTSGGIYTDGWDFTITSTASVVLTTPAPNFQGWTGTFAGNTGIVSHDDAVFAGCTEHFSQTYHGPISGVFTLHLQGDNQY